MNNKINFCTLFDSNYLDKGITLYKSLLGCSSDFVLYLFAFDEKSYYILKNMDLENAVIISEEEFMFDELSELKKIRKRSEYCWTCTPVIIEYVLEQFSVDNCTYIDADMYFYSDPAILIDEIKQSGSSVSIIEHGFPKHIEYSQSEKLHGKYCVEFNTFFNDAKGRKVLKWWKARCLECCSSTGENGTFGDQKYLDCWTRDFEAVHVLDNPGAGVAPWNISRFKLENEDGTNIMLKEKASGKEYPLIFYHFHNLNFIQDNCVKLGVYNRPGSVDSELLDSIYDIYFKDLLETREELHSNYGIEFVVNADKEKKKRRGGKGLGRTPVDILVAILSLCRNIVTAKKDIRYLS